MLLLYLSVMQYTFRTKCCTAPIFHSYSLLLIEKAFDCSAQFTCICTLVTGIRFAMNLAGALDSSVLFETEKNKRKKCIDSYIVVKSAYNFISTILYSECSIQQCKYKNHSLSFVYICLVVCRPFTYSMCVQCAMCILVVFLLFFATIGWLVGTFLFIFRVFYENDTKNQQQQSTIRIFTFFPSA